MERTNEQIALMASWVTILVNVLLSVHPDLQKYSKQQNGPRNQNRGPFPLLLLPNYNGIRVFSAIIPLFWVWLYEFDQLMFDLDFEFRGVTR